jgi:hypothetical protein
VNRGHHRLFTGGRYDACLVLPVVEPVVPEQPPVE